MVRDRYTPPRSGRDSDDCLRPLLSNPVWAAVTETVTHTPQQAAIGRNMAPRHVRAVESATH